MKAISVSRQEMSPVIQLLNNFMQLDKVKTFIQNNKIEYPIPVFHNL
jgi:hypothetical protein